MGGLQPREAQDLIPCLVAGASEGAGEDTEEEAGAVMAGAEGGVGEGFESVNEF